MKSLTQTINEKLKIRKSPSNNIKRFELYSEIYNDEYLNEFLIAIWGKRGINNIEIYPVSKDLYEVQYETDDDLIKILVLVYVLYDPMFYNSPGKPDDNYLDYYIDNEKIIDFTDEYFFTIENEIDDLKTSWNEIYDEVINKLGNPHHKK